MTSIRDMTFNLNFHDKTKLKLRAIAKHVGALADELDDIDAMNDEDLKELELKVLLGKRTIKTAENLKR